MKERPILFNGAMVRSLLAGQKTQTRRIVKPRKDLTFGCLLHPNELAGEVNSGNFENSPWAPGDRLWVREAFAYSVIDPEGLSPEDDPENYDIIYRATDHPAGGWSDGEGNSIQAPWKPSIHMPRWASRISLEIVSVRIERLQDISEADVLAEGCNGGHGSIPGYSYNASPAEHFMHVWASAYGNDSWIDNPWVWVVEFRRLP